MRKTKIICTIGPSSEKEEILRKLIISGMNVARFNFSHGTHEEHRKKFVRLQRIRIQMNMPIATLLDTKGPEIRLKDFKNGKVELRAGQLFTLMVDDVIGDENRASITYPGLVHDVQPGDSILIDDGLIEMRVQKVSDREILCQVVNGGPVSNHKGINVPDVALSMPFISEQDRSDICFGCDLDFDFIACSFTRTADDIREVRKILEEQHSHMQVIAKIESTQGVQNIDEILQVADGVMVARGDLGVEVPLEEVPVIQKKIIDKALNAGKIVITATQMLDSMIHNPRPTRAETTDVANAIYDGTTAIMLSGETAAGEYPVEAVQIMSRIAERTERDINYKKRREEGTRNISEIQGVTAAITHASCSISEEVGAKGILAVTLSGFTARWLSHYRPSCPIFACTTDVRVACQLNLQFGVIPLLISMEESETKLFRSALHRAEMAGLVQEGDKVVMIAGIPLGSSGHTNMIRVTEIRNH